MWSLTYSERQKGKFTQERGLCWTSPRLPPTSQIHCGGSTNFSRPFQTCVEVPFSREPASSDTAGGLLTKIGVRVGVTKAALSQGRKDSVRQVNAAPHADTRPTRHSPEADIGLNNNIPLPFNPSGLLAPARLWAEA